jgi:hypothetical protein
VIALAVETGVPPEVWRREGARAIITAVKILEEREKKSSKGGGTSPEPGGSYAGVQLSG